MQQQKQPSRTPKAMHTHYYNSGKPYTGLCNRQPENFADFLRKDDLYLCASPPRDWPELWHSVNIKLKNRNYTEQTILLYRQVLRQFRSYCSASNIPLSTINAEHIKNYIYTLVDKDYTWSWIGTNISVFRTAFDKICGLHLTEGLITPKRGRSLPEILSQNEINRLLNAATTMRDQLMLGLMYGCALKAGELLALRWEDINIAKQCISINSSYQLAARSLPLPPELLPVLKEGTNLCQPQDYIFQGRYGETHLSKRMVELIVRKAALSAQLSKPVSCMTLRHSYAVHHLELGTSVREVQESLGHHSIKTTLRYQGCILPKGFESPLKKVRQLYPENHSSSSLSSLPFVTCPTIHQSDLPICKSSPEPKNLNLLYPGHLGRETGRATLSLASPAPITPIHLVKFRHATLMETLKLPFRDETPLNTLEKAKEYFQILKTQISRRFMASQKGWRPPG